MRLLALAALFCLALVGSAGAQTMENCPQSIPISQTGSTDLYTSHNIMHICSVVLVNGGTGQSVSLVEGTGSTCGTNTVALMGSTSGSMVFPISGILAATSSVPWLRSHVKGNHLCLLQSGSTNISGVITLADQ